MLFLLLLSLTLKCIVLVFTGVINVDGARYLSAAQEFAQGNFSKGLAIEKMPFYPLLIVVLHTLIYDWELAGQGISLLAMVLTTIPIYLITRDLFSARAAFWAGLAFAVSPILNEHAADIIRGPLALFFLAWAVYFGGRALATGKSRDYLMAGCFSLLGGLSRIEGMLFLIYFVFVLLVLVLMSRQERPGLWRGLGIVAVIPVVLVIVMVFLSGYGTEISRFQELVTRSQSLLSLDFLDGYKRLYSQLKELEKTLPNWKGTASFAETARHYLPLIYLIGLLEALLRNLFPPLLIPLLVGFSKRNVLWRRQHWFVMGTVILYSLAAYYFLLTNNFISKRYVLLPALLLTPWVGQGLDGLWSWAVKSCRPKFWAVTLLLIFCVVPVYKTMAGLANQEDIVKVAGLWLSTQENLSEATLITTDERIPYYAGRGWDFSVYYGLDYAGMLLQARVNNIDLLIIETSKKERESLPGFEGYSLMKEFMGHKNVVLIYRRL